MSNLTTSPGELTFSVQIIRKATGLVENVDLVGYVDAEKLEELKAAGFFPAPEPTESQE